MTKKMQEDKIRAALVSWDSLNEQISLMSEEDVLAAIRVESSTAARKSMLKRLTQRLNGIRVAQVHREVSKEAEEVIDGSARRNRRRD